MVANLFGLRTPSVARTVFSDGCRRATVCGFLVEISINNGLTNAQGRHVVLRGPGARRAGRRAGRLPHRSMLVRRRVVPAQRRQERFDESELIPLRFERREWDVWTNDGSIDEVRCVAFQNTHQSSELDAIRLRCRTKEIDANRGLSAGAILAADPIPRRCRDEDQRESSTNVRARSVAFQKTHRSLPNRKLRKRDRDTRVFQKRKT